MAKRISKAAVEQDVAGLRGWLAGLWAPVGHFFEGRALWLLAVPIAVWAYYDRAVIKTWITLILGAVLIVGVALLLRKAIMPRIDIQEAAFKAQEDPLGAALIFLGGVAFMIAVIAALVMWLGSMRV